MSNQRLTIMRLQKQERSLEIDPIPNLLVKRKGLLNFHFCIYGLEGVYDGGFYHGVLELAPDYPFSPPQLKFFTQSGRFQTNKPICTSFTNFHKELWTSAWNIRTMLLGVISFMTSPQGGYGSLAQSDAKKRLLAQKSLHRNMQHPQFVQLFKPALAKLKLFYQNYSQLSNSSQKNASQTNPGQKQTQIKKQIKAVQNSNAVYILVVLLILVLISYGFYRTQSIGNVDQA